MAWTLRTVESQKGVRPLGIHTRSTTTAKNMKSYSLSVFLVLFSALAIHTRALAQDVPVGIGFGAVSANGGGLPVYAETFVGTNPGGLPVIGPIGTGLLPAVIQPGANYTTLVPNEPALIGYRFTHKMTQIVTYIPLVLGKCASGTFIIVSGI